MAAGDRVRVAGLGTVEVVLAAAVDALPRPQALPGGCLYEPKWDGYRVVLLRGPDGCRVQSRRGTDLTRAFGDLAAAAVEHLPPETVLDGEAVIWREGRVDFAALQRRIAAATSPARAARAASELPASFAAFDALVLRGLDVRPLPLRERRARLEALLTTARPPLQLSPATAEVTVAEQWLRDYAYAHVGIEGLVVKGLADPYVGGSRRWRKLRTRDTVEVLVGAVTGTLDRPDRLILAVPAPDGGLVVAGGTGRLSPAQAREVAALLRPPAGPPAPPHPWPTLLPAGRAGVWAAGGDLEVTLVAPTLVVEVLADTAHEYGRWRHLTRFVRLRPELHPSEISPWLGNAQEP